MRDEITRRLVHASGTAVPLSYLLVDAVAWWHVQALLLVGLVVGVVLEAIRLVVGLDWWIYEKLTREYEQDNPAGYVLAVVGMAVVVVVFPPTTETLLPGLAPSPVAVPALFMLTIADPVSGLLGSGTLDGVKQTWVLLATFGVATLLAVPFVPSLAAIAGGVATTVADGVKPVVRGYVVDDNLSIPVAAAVAMYVAVEFLPALPSLV